MLYFQELEKKSGILIKSVMDKGKGKSKDPVKSTEGTKAPKDGINKDTSTAGKEPADKKSESKKPK